METEGNSNMPPCPRCVSNSGEIYLRSIFAGCGWECPGCKTRYQFDTSYMNKVGRITALEGDNTKSVSVGSLGLAIPTPQWLQEKRMDTFSRAISIYHEGVDEVHFAKWCVNEFDKFFETGLAKEGDVQEPEVSEVKYKAVVEDEGSEQHGIYTYMGFVCVTDKEGKQTIVKDMPVLGEGVDEDISLKNFHTHGKEIIEQLKIEGRFE